MSELNDLVNDYLGKAVQIRPRKGVGHIIDRDPTDNSFLILFGEDDQKWAKPEKLKFLDKPAKRVTFVDFDGEASHASPSIHISDEEIIIYRPVFSDPEVSIEALMAPLPSQPHPSEDRLLDLIDELGLSFNIGNALLYAINHNNSEQALVHLEREVRRKK